MFLNCLSRCASSLGENRLESLVVPLARIILHEAPQLPLNGVADSLLALVMLRFVGRESAEASEALWTRALELCEEVGSGEIDPTAVAKLLAARDGWQALKQTPAGEDDGLSWLDALYARGAAATGTAARIDPPPPPALLRSVLQALTRDGGSVVASGATPSGAFCADLVWTVPCMSGGLSAHMAVEVDGPDRMVHGGRELLPICVLKQKALERAFDGVVRVAFWEVAQGDAEVTRLVRQRSAAVRDRVGVGNYEKDCSWSVSGSPALVPSMLAHTYSRMLRPVVFYMLFVFHTRWMFFLQKQ